MPLNHSKSPGAFKENVRTLMHDVGKSPHVQSREQALAIAYATARRAGAKYASGGTPFGERMAARALYREGFLHGNGPGRVDHLPITVKGSSYVVPADHLAAIGQGNSQAGAAILGKMFNMIPGGGGALARAPHMRSPMPHLNLKPPKMARGGHENGVKIVAANGEFIVPPEKLIERFGDLNKAHKAMDKWIVETRKKHARTLRKLKPPRKD